MADNPYSALPAVGPYAVTIGAALITMVEPHLGHAEAYNRWYEDDHFYAGAMAMPWMFAGRRWVAPASMQKLRQPATSAIAQPLEAGTYLATYWITGGRYEDHMRWTVATNQRLNADGRIYHQRDHVFTAFQRHLGVAYRDRDADGRGTGPRDIHAFDYPYAGLVVEVVDAPDDGSTDDVVTWLRAERAPAVLGEGSPVGMGVYFTPIPLPEDRMSYVKQVEGLGRRVTVLWFTEVAPGDCWDARFADTAAAWERSGAGRLELLAPFLPTVPGTNAYVDDLR